MGTIKAGARQAVVNCMKINKKDKVVIITDKKTEKLSNYILEECIKITPFVQNIILEDYGKRPIKSLPSQIRNHLSNATAVFYMAESKPGEKSSLRLPIIKYIRKGKARQAHMPDITDKIMKQGMNTDYNKIKEISKKLFSILKKTKIIEVKTKKGTNIKVEFNKKWKWIIADGDIKNSKTGWSNLPDGEVFTCPLKINGKLIVDGCLGDYFIKKGILKHPIEIILFDSKVKSLKTKDKKLEAELKKYIRQDKNSDHVGEFAIGTNIGLKNLIGNLLQDEKFPGIHIALGDSYPEETLAPFPSKGHLDMVIKRTTIIADGKTIMKDGKFKI